MPKGSDDAWRVVFDAWNKLRDRRWTRARDPHSPTLGSRDPITWETCGSSWAYPHPVGSSVPCKVVIAPSMECVKMLDAMTPIEIPSKFLMIESDLQEIPELYGLSGTDRDLIDECLSEILDVAEVVFDERERHCFELTDRTSSLAHNTGPISYAGPVKPDAWQWYIREMLIEIVSNGLTELAAGLLSTTTAFGLLSRGQLRDSPLMSVDMPGKMCLDMARRVSFGMIPLRIEGILAEAPSRISCS